MIGCFVFNPSMSEWSVYEPAAIAATPSMLPRGPCRPLDRSAGPPPDLPKYPGTAEAYLTDWGRGKHSWCRLYRPWPNSGLKRVASRRRSGSPRYCPLCCHWFAGQGCSRKPRACACRDIRAGSGIRTTAVAKLRPRVLVICPESLSGMIRASFLPILVLIKTD